LFNCLVFQEDFCCGTSILKILKNKVKQEIPDFVETNPPRVVDRVTTEAPDHARLHQLWTAEITPAVEPAPRRPRFEKMVTALISK